MSGGLTSIAGFLAAGTVTVAVTPLAESLARRTDFYDHPVGYKAHERPTPYLGGAAVLAGFAAAAFLVSEGAGRFAPLLLCAAGLFAIGTLDDRLAVAPRWRILAEVAAAVVLSATGLGWTIFDSELANLALTMVWVVGVVNAFNLMDNLDGAAATVAGVCAAGIGTLGLVGGDLVLGALALALSGACVGFLPHNLTRPARIFLGDGGSMPLGLLVAGTAISAADRASLGGAALLAGAMLVGLPILDTALVVLSRARERIPLVRAGRDHLTHRLLIRLHSPHRVALALAGTQGLLCGLAIAGGVLGASALSGLAAVCLAEGAAVLILLDSPAWRPLRPRPPEAFTPAAAPSLEVAFERPAPSRAEVS